MSGYFPEEIQGLLQRQVGVEFSNSQLYLSASLYFADLNFEGIASFLRVESEEERKHGLKIADFITKRDRSVNLEALNAPKHEWKSAVEVFVNVHEAEVATTAAISAILDLAHAKRDHATYAFFLPYIHEQVQSEDKARVLVDKVKAYSAMPGLLYHLDKELTSSSGLPLY